jgi:uncharacterized membrane protein YecN with MAPEG domain
MNVTPAAQAAALWVALHIILLLVLGVLVSRQRRTHKVALGNEGPPSLELAVRAHANAAETIPVGLAGLLALVLVGTSPWIVHAIGAALFLSRVLHATGLSRSRGPSRPRVLGMTLTWLTFIALALVLLVRAFI